MAIPISDRIQKHTGDFVYNGKHIPFHFWSHTAGNQKPDTVMFLGTGQINKIPKWVAEAAPAGVVVVQGAPHWHSKDDGSDLFAVTAGFSIQALQIVCDTFDVPAMHVIAGSQGVPMILYTVLQHPEKVRNLGLLLPLGFSKSALGATSDIRLKTLKRRALRTAFQPANTPFHDPKNLYIALTLLRVVFRGRKNGASSAHYATGLAYDSLEDLKQVVDIQTHKHNSLTVLLGENDKIFRPDEVKESLRESAFKSVRVVTLSSVSHSSLAVRASRKTIAETVSQVRQSPR